MKTTVKLLSALFCSITLLATNAIAESSVWKVSKGGGHFYVGGTVHLLSPDDHPLPDEFHKAYAEADQLIFETDITGAQTAEFQQKLLTEMTFQDGKTLQKVLKPAVYEELVAYLTGLGIPANNVASFKPWGISLTMTLIEYQRNGLSPEFGVEEYFSKLAVSDKKPILSLETIDEQLSFLKSMEKIESNEMIEYSLEDLRNLPEFINVLKTSWRNGDIEKFSENSSIIQLREKFPDFYDTLVVNRNNNWMPVLSELNKTPEIEFVLVGALHLNGKEGVLQQLKSKGFSVKQL